MITKQLVGHVDNSAYPLITVDIQLTLTTPANATGPVPVIMEFGFARRSHGQPGARGAAPMPGTVAHLATTGPRQGLGLCHPRPEQHSGRQRRRPDAEASSAWCNKGQPRKPDDWGALRAWAWGASRALDYFETDKAVDAKQVGIEGLSRYGKAALVAMAYDPRFAIGFIGSSGEGGAKLHRRNFGELVENLAELGRVPLDGRATS